MQKHLPIDFIVDVLNDVPIPEVDYAIGTQVPIELFESAEPLSDVDAGLCDDAATLLEVLSNEFNLLVALVVQDHLICPIFPVSLYRNQVLSWVKHAAQTYYSLAGIDTCDPAIAVAPVLGHNHYPGPDVLIAVVPVVFFILLDEVQPAG